MNLKSKPVQIADRGERNATLGVACEGLALIGLRVPGVFDGAAIGIQASLDNAAWEEIHDHAGATPLAGIPARAGRLVSLDPDLTAPWPYLRVVTDRAQQPGVSFTLRLAEI